MSEISFQIHPPMRRSVSRICAAVITITAIGAYLPEDSAKAAEVATVMNSQQAPMGEMEAKFVRATKAQIQEGLGEVDTKGALAIPADRAEKALAALRKSKAEFFSNPQTISRSGKRAVVEAVRELRYPTTFEPSKTELGKVLPLTFETRKVGVTMEFEPVVNPGGIDLTLVPSIVTFRGFVQYPNGKPGLDASDPSSLDELLKEPLREGSVWQPIFSTQKLTTSVSMAVGQAVVLGLMPPGGWPSEEAIVKEGKVDERNIYVFVTARVIAED